MQCSKHRGRADGKGMYKLEMPSPARKEGTSVRVGSGGYYPLKSQIVDSGVEVGRGHGIFISVKEDMAFESFINMAQAVQL